MRRNLLPVATHTHTHTEREREREREIIGHGVGTQGEGGRKGRPGRTLALLSLRMPQRGSGDGGSPRVVGAGGTEPTWPMLGAGLHGEEHRRGRRASPGHSPPRVRSAVAASRACLPRAAAAGSAASRIEG